MFRATRDGDEKPLQTFHPTLLSAQTWAAKVVEDGRPVLIYKTTESLVDTVVAPPPEVLPA